MEDILDSELSKEAQPPRTYQSIALWWFQKRLFYNKYVGLFGLTLLTVDFFIILITDQDSDMITACIITGLFFAFFANISFTLGVLIEWLLILLFGDTHRVKGFGQTAFGIGLILSMLLTFLIWIISIYIIMDW